jgi:hypothetical protein
MLAVFKSVTNVLIDDCWVVLVITAAVMNANASASGPAGATDAERHPT